MKIALLLFCAVLVQPSRAAELALRYMCWQSIAAVYSGWRFSVDRSIPFHSSSYRFLLFSPRPFDHSHSEWYVHCACIALGRVLSYVCMFVFTICVLFPLGFLLTLHRSDFDAVVCPIQVWGNSTKHMQLVSAFFSVFFCFSDWKKKRKQDSFNAFLFWMWWCFVGQCWNVDQEWKNTTAHADNMLVRAAINKDFGVTLIEIHIF